MNRRAFAVLGTSCIALGCAAHDDPDRLRALNEAPARNLVGTWDATFQLDRAVIVTATVAPSAPVTGAIAFVESHTAAVDAPQLHAPTHTAVYDLDFRPFGFDLGVGGSKPVGVARTSAPDSVVVFLAPSGSLFSVRLEGVLTGDTLRGIWNAESSRAGAGGGRFILRRRPADSTRPRRYD